MDIRWTAEAKKQLKGITQYYIDKEAFRTVESLQKEIRSVANLLLAFPFLGYQEEDIMRHKENLRSIVIRKHYKLIYTVTDKEIIITALWDVRQDPEVLYKG